VIRVKCPACGREWEFGDYLAGLTAVCKGCGGRVPVPAPQPQAPVGADAITAAPGLTLTQPPAAPSPAGPSEEAIQPPPGVTSSPPATAALAAPEVRSVSFDSPAPPSPPDWAIEHAAVSLRVGQSVPEIEQRLVARGLTPADAAAAVSRALEGGVRDAVEPLATAERRQRVHRILAAAVGCACLLLAYQFNGGYSAGKTLLWTLMPLACISFPDAMGGAADPLRVILLRWCGWLALLAICGYRAWLLWIIS
jgi:hypothetical protein